MRRDQPDASVRTRPGVRRRIVIRIIGLLITAISLYVVLPGLIRLFGDIPALRSVFPAWFVPVFVLESLAFVSIWELQRIAIRTHNWFDVATAQLAGNALSRALPGGVATGRRHPVPDADAGGVRGHDGHDVAHRRRPAVDGDAVHAARARAAGADLRSRGRFATAARRRDRRGRGHLPALGRVAAVLLGQRRAVGGPGPRLARRSASGGRSPRSPSS